MRAVRLLSYKDWCSSPGCYERDCNLIHALDVLIRIDCLAIELAHKERLRERQKKTNGIDPIIRQRLIM